MKSWEETKQSLWGGFLLFGMPIILYFFIKWDPFILRDKDGEPITLGFWLVAILYWVALFFIHKYKSETKLKREQLKRLLDGSMSEMEKSLLEKEVKNFK